MTQHKLLSRDDERASYRGWLRNPRTGRTFKANHITARRPDLEMVDGPGDASPRIDTKHRSGRRVHSDREQPDPETAVDVEVQRVSDERVETGASDEANERLDQVAAESKETEDKDRLKTLGAELGLSLTKAMNIETMREHIADRVELMKSFEGD